MNKRTIILTVLSLTVVCMAAPAKDAETPTAEVVVKTFSHQGTLDSAIRALAKQTAKTIHVDWKALDAAGVSRLSTVDLTATKTSLGDLLELMLVQVSKPAQPIAWVMYDSKLWVTTQRKALLLQSGHVAPTPRAAGKPVAHTTPSRPSTGMTVNFNKKPLEDIIEFFRTQTKANFHVSWAALKTKDIDRSTPVSLKLTNVSASTVLDKVCDSLSADQTDPLERIFWTIDKGVVLMSTGEALDATMRTKVYDITDLLAVVPNFKGPRVDTKAIGSNNNTSSNGVSSGGSSGSSNLFEDTGDKDKSPEPESAYEQRKRNKESIIAIFKNSIGEDLWAPSGKGTITIHGKKLVISQSLLGFELMRRAAQ